MPVTTRCARTGIILLLIGVGLGACNRQGPAAPTPTLAPASVPAPAPNLNTRRIIGDVFDTAFRAVAGARIEVVEGPDVGATTTSDTAGEFLFVGVFDETSRFRATRDGYVSATRPFQVLPGANYVSFQLEAVDPPVDVAGQYALTVIADSTCVGLPADLRTRTYAATVSARPILPAGRYFSVLVAGAQLLQDLTFKNFSVGVAGDYVAFVLGDGETSPGLVEQVGADTYLAFGGEGGLIGGTPDTTLSFSFSGFIDYCAMNSPMTGSNYRCVAPATHTRCQSNNHRVIWSRQ